MKTRAGAALRHLTIIALAATLALSGCTTTTPESTDGHKSACASGRGNTPPRKATHKLFLVYPDGTRVEIPDHETPPSAAFVAAPYEWNPEVAPEGKVQIEVVLDEQKLYVLRGGRQIAYTQISTGKEGHDTPAGSYKVLEKKPMHHSGLYGSFVSLTSGKTLNHNANASDKAPDGTKYVPSPMPFFQRLTWDGVGLHEGYLPGYPASHGCIRLHPDMSEKLYSVTKVGTPVTISHTRTIFPKNPPAPAAAPAAAPATPAATQPR